MTLPTGGGEHLKNHLEVHLPTSGAVQVGPLDCRNDDAIWIDVHNAGRDGVHAETRDRTFACHEVAPNVHRCALPADDVAFALGRFPVWVHAQGTVHSVILNLVGPTQQVERFRPITDALLRSPLAQLVTDTVSANEGPGKHPIGPQWLREVATHLGQASRLLAMDPPTRVRTRREEVDMRHAVPQDALREIATRPNRLRPTLPSHRSLRIAGRHYQVGTLDAVTRSESTDTTETQFVHAVTDVALRTADLTLDRVATQLARLDRVARADVRGAYQSLSALTVEHMRGALEEDRREVNRARADLTDTRRILKEYAPVTRTRLRAAMTPRMVRDSRYRRAVNALRILSEGSRFTADPSGFVAAISSLTTLFELYVLDRVLAAVEARGFVRTRQHHDPESGTFDGPHTLLDGRPFPNVFVYHHPAHGRLTVHYEPRISRGGHAETGLECVFVKSSFLTPDVVIVTNRAVWMLDAKTARQPRDETVNELVVRYLHGIRPVGGARIMAGLLIPHFSDDASPRSVHASIATPAIWTAPIHPHRPDITDGFLGLPDLPYLPGVS